MPERGIDVVEMAALSALPGEALDLFRRDDPFSTLAWYHATAAHALPEGATAVFVVFRQAKRVCAVLPMQRGPGRRVAALASPFASLWQPLFSEEVAHDAACVQRIGVEIGRLWRAMPLVRLDALDGEAFYFAPLARGLRKAGLRALRFEHFGNWHQTLPDRWADYLAGRPANLRATIRRRGKRLLMELDARISVIAGGADLARGIAAYEAIYAASWKMTEPYGDFIGAFMREAARAGTLRLFLLHMDGRPIAAQVWIVQGGCGHLLKLAHLETARALSPGTVLTAHAIEHLMQHDGIGAIDFGRGDDAYKKMWTGVRRQRVGFVFANPATLPGAAAIVRHAAGVVRRRMRPRDEKGALLF